MKSAIQSRRGAASLRDISWPALLRAYWCSVTSKILPSARQRFGRPGKFCRVSILLAFGLWVNGAQSSPRGPDQLRISGKPYLRLADWARTKDLDLHWLKRDETLQLSNGSSKLAFAVDSREVQVNGVDVWLLFPLVLRNGAV